MIRMKYVLVILCVMMVVVPAFAQLSISDTKTVSDIKEETEEILDIVAKPNMAFFGTEYQIEDNGTIFLQLTDEYGLPINDASCEISIWDENKILWYDGYPMSFLNNSNGIYYFDLIIPDDVGVYILDAYCFYSDVMYVFKEPYSVSYDGDLQGGTTDWTINFIDTDCVMMKTDKGYYHEFLFNHSSIGNMNLSAINSFDFIWTGQKKDNTNHYVWNYTDSSWTFLPPICGNNSLSGFCYDVMANKRELDYGISDIVNGTLVKVRVEMVTNKDLYTDEATIRFHDTGAVVANIRGAGELHVSDFADNIETLIHLLGDEELISNHNYCQNNDTLLRIIDKEYCIGNKCFTYQINETETCSWGCFEDEAGVGVCAPNPFMRYLLYIGVLIGIGFVFYFLWQVGLFGD